MNSREEKTLELSFIISIPLLVEFDKLPPSKVRGKLEKLFKFTAIELNSIGGLGEGPLTPSEKINALDKLTKFGLSTGWQNKDGSGNAKHMVTIISFALMLLENTNYNYSEKIICALRDLIEYYEKGNDYRDLCSAAGATAYDKWVKIINEV